MGRLPAYPQNTKHENLDIPPCLEITGKGDPTYSYATAGIAFQGLTPHNKKEALLFKSLQSFD